MESETFLLRYPRLFHMAEEGTWPSIRKHGLLSTTALLDLAGVTGPRRESIESCRRPESVTLEHPVLGSVLIRDNKPLREKFLVGCLDELSPAEWYRELNRRVFFWTSEERLVRLLGARAYRLRPHVVITVDSASLLRQHSSRVRLAPLNTGSTLYPNAPRRGRATFRAMADQPERGKGSPVVEVTVEHSVPDIQSCAVRVERRLAADVLDVIWQRA